MLCLVGMGVLCLLFISLESCFPALPCCLPLVCLHSQLSAFRQFKSPLRSVAALAVIPLTAARSQG